MNETVRHLVASLEADYPDRMTWTVPRAAGGYWWCSRPWKSADVLDGLVSAETEPQLREALKRAEP
jgi:hypothetical protein